MTEIVGTSKPTRVLLDSTVDHPGYCLPTHESYHHFLAVVPPHVHKIPPAHEHGSRRTGVLIAPQVACIRAFLVRCFDSNIVPSFFHLEYASNVPGGARWHKTHQACHCVEACAQPASVGPKKGRLGGERAVNPTLTQNTIPNSPTKHCCFSFYIEAVKNQTYPLERTHLPNNRPTNSLFYTSSCICRESTSSPPSEHKEPVSVASQLLC